MYVSGGRPDALRAPRACALLGPASRWPDGGVAESCQPWRLSQWDKSLEKTLGQVRVVSYWDPGGLLSMTPCSHPNWLGAVAARWRGCQKQMWTDLVLLPTWPEHWEWMSSWLCQTCLPHLWNEGKGCVYLAQLHFAEHLQWLLSLLLPGLSSSRHLLVPSPHPLPPAPALGLFDVIISANSGLFWFALNLVFPFIFVCNSRVHKYIGSGFFSVVNSHTRFSWMGFYSSENALKLCVYFSVASIICWRSPWPQKRPWVDNCIILSHCAYNV